jgi:predicted acetyltransferase
MQLLLPTREHLPAYVAALERGWSADNMRGAAAAQEDLQRIAADADAFLAAMDDPQALGPPVTLPDGRQVARIPGIRRWMWDDDAAGSADPASRFIGNIGLRWMAGNAPLPPHVLGHIGYTVVPWQQGRGHATRALALVLGLARERGLPFVELTTDPDNLASQRVIERNGGVFVERFDKGAAYGHKPGLRYRIDL